MATLALLGDDPAVLPLVRALAEGAPFRLSHAALTGELAPPLLAEVPGLRITAGWEGLLEESIAGVIVAGSSEAILDGARRLAGEGKPLLLWPQALAGSTFFHELSLVRDDNHVLLVPAFPARFLPEIIALRRDAAEGKLGRIVQWQIERDVPCDYESGPAMLTPEDVTGALLGDADLLRSLGGNYDRVTALYAGVVDGRFSTATVTLAGEGLPDAVWTARAVPGSTSRNSTLPASAQVERGRWSLAATGTAGRREHRWGGESSAERAAPAWAAPLLEEFAAAIEGHSASPDWNDLLRAAEVVDAARRSIARRRTIDLLHETASERGQFKSQMTALGCGVLLLTPVLVVALLLVGAALKPPPWLMNVARVAVFLPLFIYLVLQALVFIARPSRRER